LLNGTIISKWMAEMGTVMEYLGAQTNAHWHYLNKIIIK
jgi:hypothetical protein